MFEQLAYGKELTIVRWISNPWYLMPLFKRKRNTGFENNLYLFLPYLFFKVMIKIICYNHGDHFIKIGIGGSVLVKEIGLLV